MPSVPSLIAAHRPRERESLQALAVALAATLVDPPPLPDDPVAALEVGETQGSELSGTWQQVRAARDYGDLSPAEYDYLAAQVEALTMEG